MAYVVKINGNDRAFSISQAVGKGNSNLWTDCMLVLYLLKQISVYGAYTNTADHFFPMVIKPKEDYANIPLVSKMILAFQTYESNRGVHLKKDGKVSCPPTWFSGSKVYTMQHLNTVYQAHVISLFNDKIDPVQLALDDHEMPEMLRGQLIASSVFEGVI